MAIPKTPSAAITVSGVIAIIVNIFAALGVLLTLLVLRLASVSPRGPKMQVLPRPMVEAMMLCFLAIGVFGILTGVGLLRLKDWARRAMVIYLGAIASLCLACLYLGLRMFALPSLRPGVIHFFHQFLPVVFVILGIAIWWLTLFTRPSIVAQFTDPLSPNCPLPLAMLSSYFFSFGVMVIPSLAIRARLPTMVFGHPYVGRFPKGFILISVALCIFSGIGILKLRPWGLNLAIGLGILGLANHLVTLISPKSIPLLRDALAAMALQGYPAPRGDPSVLLRYDHGFAVAMWIIVLFILFTWRTRFLQTVAAVAQKP